MQKVMLTLPDDLLQEIAELVGRTKKNRSEVVRQALREHLDGIKKRDLEQRMAEGYKELAKENTHDAHAYLRATKHIKE